MYIFCPSMPFTRSVDTHVSASRGERRRRVARGVDAFEQPSASRSARKHPRATARLEDGLRPRRRAAPRRASPPRRLRARAPPRRRARQRAGASPGTRHPFSFPLPFPRLLAFEKAVRSETFFEWAVNDARLFAALPVQRARPPVKATKAFPGGAPDSWLLSSSLNGTPSGYASLYSYGKNPSARSRTYDRFRAESANARKRVRRVVDGEAVPEQSQRLGAARLEPPLAARAHHHRALPVARHGVELRDGRQELLHVHGEVFIIAR